MGLAIVALATLASVTGCEACAKAKEIAKDVGDVANSAKNVAKDVVDRATETPDKPTAERLLRDHLRNAAELAARVCGVEKAAGLDVESLQLEDSPLHLGSWNANLIAKARDAEKGGIKIERVVMCTAALVLTAIVVARDADGKPSEWGFGDLDVVEIKTPGAEWKKPEHHHEHHDWD